MGVLERHRPALGMIGLQFHYAALAIFTRAALLDGMSPTVFVVYRQGIASLALAPMVLSSKRRQSIKVSMRLRTFLLMFATSLIGVTANQNAYFKGLFYASSTAATAMSNLIPALTFVIATIIGFEKIDLRSLRSVAKILGTVCAVGGALTMALVKGQKLLHMGFIPSKYLNLTASGGVDENWLLGCLLLSASSVFWSCWIIMQVYSIFLVLESTMMVIFLIILHQWKKSDLVSTHQQVPISTSCPDHLLSTFWMCLFSTIQAALFALLYEQDLQPWILHTSLECSCCLYAGIGIAVSFFAQTWCISERGPVYCAMFNPLATVITALISTIFLKEELYVGSLVGAIGVIAGLYVVLWGKAKEFEEIKKEASQSNLQVDDEISCRIDLEEPLLSEKSSENIVAENKMEP